MSLLFAWSWPGIENEQLTNDTMAMISVLNFDSNANITVYTKDKR